MIAIINNQQAWISIQAPYDYNFVQDLKSKIHYTDRKWDRNTKIWMVTEAEANNAIAVAARYFEICDQRGVSADDAEENVLQTEIKEIEDNQEYIIKQSGHIRDTIEALNDAIGAYSYTSKSRIKSRMHKDAALLSHSLNNAQKPIEQLVELEIRGLAAAVHLIGENSIVKLTSR